MWNSENPKQIKYKLFFKDDWSHLQVSIESAVERRKYIESCKKDVLLFNLDHFAMTVKEGALSGTQLEKEAYKKIAGATEKFLNVDLKKICANLLKGKPFMDALSIIGGKEMSDQIINFCKNETK